MSVNLSPVAGAAAQFLDNSGNVLTGGKLYTYLAGTTTPAATYTSSTGVTFHSNPIILDAAGRVPNGGEIWLSDNVSYKFVLKDSNDVLIGTWDNLIGINSNFVNYTSQEEIIVATAGQTVFNLTTVTYVPGTNSLQVFVDGVNQYDGITYAYVETDATTVTFTAGLHVGALVKFTTAVSVSAGSTTANLVIYNQGGLNAVDRTVESKLQESVSIQDFGAVGDGVTDDTFAIQTAMDYAAATSKSLFVPPGTYIISARVYQQTSGARITIFGAGYNASIFKAAATLTNTEMLWFGNNTGHGVYGLFLRDIGIDGNNKTQNLTGIAAIENGLSHFENIRISNCGLAARCDGSIHMIWDGHNEVRLCDQGISFLRIPTGIPANSFDYTKTLSSLAMSTNISTIKNTWFGDSPNGCIIMEGGLVSVENCVFQSPGGDVTKSVVTFENANESYDYGGGPRFINNWIEGGTYKYWVEIIRTRNAILKNNFFSGSGADSEGGFLLWQGASNSIIEGNSFRGAVSATPTEGRYRNAAVYYDIDGSVTFPFTYRDNYLTKSGGTNLQFVLANTTITGTTSWRYSYYQDGNGVPPVVYDTSGGLLYYPEKNVHAHGCVTYAAGVPTLEFGSNIYSITDSGVGYLTVQYARQKAVNYQPFVASAELTGGAACMVSTIRSSVSIDRVRVYDSTGATIDPISTSFVCYGATQ